MKHSIAVAGLLIAGLGYAAACEPSSTVVRGDFDGDEAVDQAVLFQHKKSVTVSIQIATSAKPQQLQFRVDPGAQDAICGVPAALILTPQICSPMDEPLAGCIERAGAVYLSLSGGGCDAIHMYWDHQAGHMAWWRL